MENKKVINKIIRLLLIILIVILAVILCLRSLGAPYDKTNNTYSRVTIREGDSTEAVAEKLQSAEIIRSESRYCFLSKIMFFEGTFKPGTYYLSPSMTMVEIANTLKNGISTVDGFELPPGLTVKQTAVLLEQAGYSTKDEFLEAAAEIDFSEFDFIDSSSSIDAIEGFLYPTNYNIDNSANAVMIITSMLNEFDNFFDDTYRARAEELGLSIRDVVVLASMIEKETSIDKEKPVLASVLLNRLNLGMDDSDELTQIPLCSPSKASIKAVLYPDDTEYTYYVHSDKLNGTHVFTSDKDEYDKLLKAYKKAEKAQKDEEKDTEADD